MAAHRWFDTAILPPVLRRARHRWAVVTVAALSVPAVLTGWTVGYLNDGPVLPNIDHNVPGYLDAVPTLPAVATEVVTSASRPEPVRTATPPKPRVGMPVVPSAPATTSVVATTSAEPTTAAPTSAAETSSATPSTVMTGPTSLPTARP